MCGADDGLRQMDRMKDEINAIPFPYLWSCIHHGYWSYLLSILTFNIFGTAPRELRPE
jgi:hypothetical protein